MRQRFDYSEHDEAYFRARIRKAPFVHALTADNFDIQANTPSVIFLDPGGASRDVRLPDLAVATNSGLEFIIVNTADAAENLVVKDSAEAATIVTIAQAGAAWVWNNGTTWYAYALNSNIAASVTNLTVTGVASVGTLVDAGPQELSGAGAVDVTSLITYFTSTGAAQALTLADGTVGQLKIIVHVVDGGSGVLTPTNYGNGTTLTFTNVGDSAMLVFRAGNWWNVGTPTAAVA